MSYKAVTRIKIDGEYVERGEEVSEDDFENWDSLVKDGVVVDSDEFDRLFPGLKEGSNQAPGTPSNLEQIEGTELQQNLPPEGDEVPARRDVPSNPADPPTVEGSSEEEGEDEEDDEELKFP